MLKKDKLNDKWLEKEISAEVISRRRFIHLANFMKLHDELNLCSNETIDENSLALEIVKF